MLVLVSQPPYRYRAPRAFGVAIFEHPHAEHLPQAARVKLRTPPRRHASKGGPSTAITYPPVPESVFDSAAAIGALRNTPDCSPENFAHLRRGQREHCARRPGAIARGNETDFLDPALRARFADELAQKRALTNGPFHTCPPASRRALMGLSCWKGMDN